MKMHWLLLIIYSWTRLSNIDTYMYVRYLSGVDLN